MTASKRLPAKTWFELVSFSKLFSSSSCRLPRLANVSSSPFAFPVYSSSWYSRLQLAFAFWSSVAYSMYYYRQWIVNYYSYIDILIIFHIDILISKSIPVCSLALTGFVWHPTPTTLPMMLALHTSKLSEIKPLFSGEWLNCWLKRVFSSSSSVSVSFKSTTGSACNETFLTLREGGQKYVF